MIEVSHFTKRYGEFVAVDDLSFSIGKGEIFGFIGPNGAGKSTTIRFLATLLRPTAGEGRVAGFSVTADRWPSAASSASCPTTSASTTA